VLKIRCKYKLFNVHTGGGFQQKQWVFSIKNGNNIFCYRNIKGVYDQIFILPNRPHLVNYFH